MGGELKEKKGTLKDDVQKFESNPPPVKVIPLTNDLSQDKNAIKVFKKPIVLKYEIAQSDGVVQTREGPVSHKAGAAILTGTQGERWPIPKESFEKTYDADVKGPGTCSKKKIEVLAVQLEVPSSVTVSWSKDPIRGEKGDWLVQYKPGDFGIVCQEIFNETYEIIPKK